MINGFPITNYEMSQIKKQYYIDHPEAIENDRESTTKIWQNPGFAENQRIKQKQVYIDHPEKREECRQRRLKQVIPFVDTKIEIKIQNYLKEKEIYFETQYPIIGQPDIYIPSCNILIFPDGDWWHGNPRQYKADSVIGGGKIAKNKWKYDKGITTKLENQGYIVLRFWEWDINNNFEEVSSIILHTIKCVRSIGEVNK